MRNTPINIKNASYNLTLNSVCSVFFSRFVCLKKLSNKLLFCIVLLVSCKAFSLDENGFEKKLQNCRVLQNKTNRLNCYDEIELSSSVENTNYDDPVFDMPILVADLEEPRIFVSLGQMNFLSDDFDAILLGVGARVKLKTIEVPRINQSVDFNMIGLIKSQFDVSEIDTRNNRGGALINTDFMIGGEIIKNFAEGNLRVKYVHQSFHLGDEFLIDNPEFIQNRLNLSYETIELFGFKHFNNWGAYLGASFIVRSEPGNLDKIKVQTGFQYTGIRREWFTPIFGLDLKSWDETDWSLNTSIKAGVEFYGFLDQPLQLMIEYSDGNSPYGQFIYDDLSFLGLSINHYW